MTRSLFVGASLLLAPAALAAQTAAPAPQTVPAAAAPTVGATIYDSAGVEIGKVDSITPQAVVIATGTTKVAVPPTSIGTTPKGPALSITKAQLDAAQAQQQQQAAASIQSQLVAGAAVNGLNGAPLGTVKSSDGTNVTLTTPNGEAKLPISGFAAGPNNTIVLGMTAEQLKTAMGGATTASTTATGDTGAATTSTTAAPADAASTSSSATTTTTSKTTKTRR